MKKYIIVLFLVSFLIIGVIISTIIVIFYPKVETWEGYAEGEIKTNSGWIIDVKGQDGDRFAFKFYCDPPFDFYVVLLSSEQDPFDFDIYEYYSYTQYWYFTGESGGEAWYIMDFPFYDTWTILIENADIISSYLSFEYYSTYKETSLDLSVLLTFICIYIFFGALSVVVVITIFKKKQPQFITGEKTAKEVETPKVQVRQISGKIYCSSCGAEILDKTGDFCSKCGAPLK